MFIHLLFHALTSSKAEETISSDIGVSAQTSLRIDIGVSKSEWITIEKFIFSAQPYYFPNIRQLFPKLQCYLFSVLLGANLFKDLRQDVTHFGLDHLVILIKLK